MIVTSSPLFSVQVKQLAHYRFCPKRSRLEVIDGITNSECHSAQAVGTKLHAVYSNPLKSFDRALLRKKLEGYGIRNKYGKIVWSRKIDNIIVKGIYDDLIVNFFPESQTKTVSFIEVKTTSRSEVLPEEIASAKFQLQLYVWMVGHIAEMLGWKLSQFHYVEFYSQRTGKLMLRLPVVAYPNIEDEIRYIVNSYHGLEKVTVTPFSRCKHCPREVREECDWYKAKRKAYGSRA